MIEVVIKAADRDAKHAEWLLERQFPKEFAPYDRRPIPQEEQAPMGIEMYATLPSGNLAPLSEMMEVARQWHEAAYPRERRDHEPEHEHDHEPMKHRFNFDTGQVEPINGDNED